MTCYRSGGCGPYEMYPCSKCPASKPEYANKNKSEVNNMYDKLLFLNYGSKYMNEFPKADEVLAKLENGQIAFITEKGTGYQYILTKELGCWSKVLDQCSTPEKRMEKVYSVEFMEHTNFAKDTVSNKAKEIGHYRYLNIGKEPFLVAESELDKYREYGGGYRSITFVGNMVR